MDDDASGGDDAMTADIGEDSRMRADQAVVADVHLLRAAALGVDRDVEAVEAVLAAAVKHHDVVAHQAVGADAGVLDMSVMTEHRHTADAQRGALEQAAEPQYGCLTDVRAERAVKGCAHALTPDSRPKCRPLAELEVRALRADHPAVRVVREPQRRDCELQEPIQHALNALVPERLWHRRHDSDAPVAGCVDDQHWGIIPLRAAVRDDGAVLHRAYVWFAGRHPRLRPWHHQWLAGTPLYQVLRPLLGSLSGDVLDVGCGEKPYRGWMPGARRWVGIDVVDGPHVDGFIEPGNAWPVRDGEFDVIVCTQVLEHVSDLDHTMRELVRGLRAGGDAVVTVPFIFGEHNAPHDYRRLSQHGLRQLLTDHGLEVVELRPQGGIGSTLGVIALCWTWDAMPRSGLQMVLVAPFLPLWALLCLVVNLAGAAIDRVDRTEMYYGNLLAHARKPMVS